MPGDFGFDLLVSDQRHRSLGSSVAVHRAVDFPYALQVKSRRLREHHYSKNSTGRREAVVNFRISAPELDLLVEEPGGYLVCVAFPPAEDHLLGEQVLSFWLHGTQLARLRGNSYFSEVLDDRGAKGYELKVGFRFLPTQSRSTLLARMQAEGKLTEAGAETLRSALPEELGTGWGAEYVALYRREWSPKEKKFIGDNTAGRKLKAWHLNLHQIGTEAEFPTDDNCENFYSRRGESQ